ncbi:spore coat U domain-containing protein [Pseudosulfitobacter sp. DSM 107133]|jgi:spore coat protein U-like protein|nr:spore coat U domain-containing protein [Pseudosulfitobacter sp. DSM 107133]UOA26193.1 hypothetical protein DSM107133_00888 [Pseudosulfitobacter sp. DSM 107133]
MYTTTLKSGALIGVLLAAAAPAFAADPVTSNLSVSAVVLDTCTLNAATALSFASIDTGAATSQVTPGSLAVICTSSRSDISVSLGAGENASGGTRRMISTDGNFLPYSVYSDAGHSSAVGAAENVYSGDVTAAVPLVIPVYGQIPAGSYNAGLYSDTILVTLTY